MLLRAVLLVLIVPLVLGTTVAARHEIAGTTYCLDSFQTARGAHCLTVPREFPTGAEKPDWSALFSALGR